jgi:hypothetical protein
MAEQKLDLLDLSSRLMAQASAASAPMPISA